jgi:hypothetical protein
LKEYLVPISGATLPLKYDSLDYAAVGNCYIHRSRYAGFPTTWQVLGPGGGHPHDPDNDWGNPHFGSFDSEAAAQAKALTIYREWLQAQIDEMGAAPSAAE